MPLFPLVPVFLSSCSLFPLTLQHCELWIPVHPALQTPPATAPKNPPFFSKKKTDKKKKMHPSQSSPRRGADAPEDQIGRRYNLDLRTKITRLLAAGRRNLRGTYGTGREGGICSGLVGLGINWRPDLGRFRASPRWVANVGTGTECVKIWILEIGRAHV